MSANGESRSQTPIAGMLVCIVASLALLYALRGIVAPFFVALLLIALIEGLVRALAHRWPRGPRWALIVLAAIIIMLLLGGCALALSFGAGQLIADAPLMAPRIDAIIGDLSRQFGARMPRLREIADGNQILAMAQPVLAGFGQLVAGASLAILYLGFMLASRALLERKVEIVAGSPEHTKRVRHLLDRISHSAGQYMWVQTVVGGIYAALCGVAFAVIGLENALFWTVLTFLLSYVPMLGGILAGAAAALFALVQFPSYWPAVAIFVSVQVIGMLAGNLLLPKMQADAQNLDPTVSIFSLALWSLLWGVTGALLATPLTVMLMIIFNQFDQTRWVAVLISNDGVPEGDAPRVPVDASR